MANISFQKFLYFATLIYTATFKPEFQLAECQFFNLFFAQTDAGNIIRRVLTSLLRSPCCFEYLPRGLLSVVSVELPVFSGIGVLYLHEKGANSHNFCNRLKISGG